MTDQSIVKSLYSLEIKLKVGQQRANNWTDEHRKNRAKIQNQKVQDIQEKQGTMGASIQEEKEIERLNKVVAKQQKINDCVKFKQEEAQYNNEKRLEKAK